MSKLTSSFVYPRPVTHPNARSAFARSRKSPVIIFVFSCAMRISFAAAALLAFDFVAEFLDRLADLSARLPKLLSRSADGTLTSAFGFEVTIPGKLSSLFLHVALGLFGFALQFVLVHRVLPR